MRERLYALLPTIYRMRDFWAGRAVAGTAPALENELLRVGSTLRSFTTTGFVETCDNWAVPYIGDLIGSRLLHPVHAAGFYGQTRWHTSGANADNGRVGATSRAGRRKRSSTCRWSSRAACQQPTARNRATTSLRCAQVLDNIGTPFGRRPDPSMSAAAGAFYKTSWGVRLAGRRNAARHGGDAAAFGGGLRGSVRLACHRAWSPASILAGLEAPMDH